MHLRNAVAAHPLSRRDAIKRLGGALAGAALVGGDAIPRASAFAGSAGEMLIAGGQVVNATGSVFADVRVLEDRIVEVAPNLTGGPDARIIDAGGKLVMPGGIDPHTHLQSSFVDDYESGTRAAVAGGITTVGTFGSVRDGEGVAEALERVRAEIEGQAIADVFIHMRTWPPSEEVAAWLPALAEHGQPSIKIYTTRRDWGERVGDLIRFLEVARESGVVTMIHCEDQRIIDAASRRLAAEGNTSLAFYGQSRPVLSEESATQQVVGLCELTGAPMQVVHVSSARALDACRKGKERGLPVYVEVRPMYLHLTEERMAGPDGPLFVGQPPLRTRSDADSLWAGLASGDADLLATDHAPWTRAQKMDPALSITNFRPGVSSLRFVLPLYYSEGVAKGRISAERFVETTSTKTAQIMGLYPEKGIIREGSLADIMILDPERTDVVRAEDDPSNSDYSLYEGWSVTGWPVMTIRRGEVVYEDGSVRGQPGTGRLVSRRPWSDGVF